MARFHKPTSLYRDTDTKDFYLDLWNPIDIPASISDKTYVIESMYNNRPDLLASKEYGSPNLWWVFALVNKDILVDPLQDFTTGTEIVIPSRKTIERII